MNDFKLVKNASVVLICVPTPLNERKKPDLSYLVEAVTSVSQNMNSKTLVIVESTVEPGTTILNAARKIGGDVVPPAMCYYSKLEGSGGKCRTCLVEVAAGSTADPRPMPN